MERNDKNQAGTPPANTPINSLVGVYQKQFQALSEVISCGLYIIDLNGRLVYWNLAAETITGLGSADVIGRPCGEIFRCDRQDLQCSLDTNSLIDGKQMNKEVALDVNGSRRYLYKKSNPIRSPQGERIGTAVSFIDLTAQREAELETLEAHKLVKSTLQAKRRFMAKMSDEIKTPVNGIVGLLDLLVAGVTTPAQRDHLMTARKSARLLMNLVGDLLNFSIFDKDEAPVEQTGFSIRSVIASVVTRQYTLTQKKEVAIHSHVADEVPDSLLGDPGRLYQILKHLVSNGIKFTPDGKVTILVQTADTVEAPVVKKQRHSIVHFSVSDTGCGIPKEKLDSIFEAFTRVDASATRNAAGLGVGLNIVNRLIEMMGGHILIESQPSKGTTVHFTLPFIKAFDEKACLAGAKIADDIDPALSEWKPPRAPDQISSGLTDQQRETADTKDPAAVQLTDAWYRKYHRVKALVWNDPKRAEALLKELREEANRLEYSQLAATLFRLLIAVRRDNEVRIKQHMDHIDSVLDDGAPNHHGPDRDLPEGTHA